MAERPERELRREAPVACVQPRAFEQRGQDARGIRVLVGDATHGLDRHRSSRGHVPNRSPGRSRTPRAQSAAGIRRRPVRRDLQQPHRPVTRRRHHPASVDVDDRAGCTSYHPLSSARSSLRSFPLNVVLAPGSGANARTRRTTAPAGRVQSTARSAGPSFGASVASACLWRGGHVLERQPEQHLRDRVGTDRREARAERAGVIVRPDRLLAPRQHGSGVHPFVHADQGHARDGVSFQDRVLDRARPAPSREQREMQVHRAEEGCVQHVAREQLAVGDDDRRRRARGRGAAPRTARRASSRSPRAGATAGERPPRRTSA